MLFLYMHGAYTTLLILWICFSSHVRQNKEDCALRTVTLIYYTSYNFIYSSNTTVTVTYMYMKHYLSEPCVGCSFTHLYLLSAFMQVLSVKPSVISAYPGTRNRLIDLGLPTYIDRQG